MSSVTLKKLPDEPIVILTISGSSADLSNSEPERAKLQSIFDEVSEPVFFIIDTSDAQLNFDQILRGASGAYRGDNPTFKHPNIRQILQVSDNPTFETVAEALDSKLFGNVKVQQFKTLEEALAYARTAR